MGIKKFGMTQRFLASVLALIALFALNPGAVGQEKRVKPRAVVELFTSQGCSACPPADEFISELARRDDVVVLSYHVDYWNYIGWKDTFGNKAFSDFQRSYAQSWRKSRVYTPQLVINGIKDMVGSHRSDVENAIASAVLPIDVRLNYEKGVLSVNAGPDPTLPELTVWLVTFLSRAQVDIDNGDNSGKILSYSQIVTGRQVLGMWDPVAGAQIKLPLFDVLKNGSDGVAIVVQYQKDGLPGQIYGAASFKM
ncbi:hypothetical protein that often co-occurs with aconitase [hydrothermal vent metagenome]|uniref:DUF1223 domain-containing protein n=1 Tax=hydrothermal vent metagenome TaxID=652676 RepID=A0A3B0TQ60_9ZZZZ